MGQAIGFGLSCHCEERSDAAISIDGDCFASLAMTARTADHRVILHNREAGDAQFKRQLILVDLLQEPRTKPVEQTRCRSHAPTVHSA
jgi:hypothetical protein